jgi:membrane-anchored protein YejM (alkaline phosphatase superfamily)
MDGVQASMVRLSHIAIFFLRFSMSVLDEPALVLPMEDYGASEEKSVLANAVILPYAYIAQLTNQHAHADNRIQAYHNEMTHARALIENNNVRFAFLHFLVPHPPGIYDRQSHSLRSGGTYLDNLVLADDALGSLLREIDATPSASQTTVIVSSDHSWRIPIWRNTEFWSTEEERASGGRFDDRPVLLIHFPGQKPGNDVNAPLPELLEHDIIAGMLRGQINNSEDLTAFLSQHGH